MTGWVWNGLALSRRTAVMGHVGYRSEKLLNFYVGNLIRTGYREGTA